MNEDPGPDSPPPAEPPAATASSEASGSEASSSPPSAAGPLEPYGAMVRLRPMSQDIDPLLVLPPLLEEIASACLEQGASILGHLKGLLRTSEGHISCNLTSVRSGASCREGGEWVVPVESEAELDLVVLVYGLPAAAIDELVGETLERLLAPMGVIWAKSASFHA